MTILVLFVLFFALLYPSSQALRECNQLPIQQFEALKALYDTTDGPSWNLRPLDKPWAFARGVSTSPLPCIEPWVGVNCTCNIASREFSVIGLILSDLSLTGYIPPQIGNLSDLVTLDLKRNRLYGSIPDTMGMLIALEGIYLDSNQITGSIPASIGDAEKLQSLFLDNNEINGTLPSSLGKLYALNILSAQSNKLSGTIPSSIFTLSRLKYLYLPYNRLVGRIPTISNKSSLTSLEVQYNLLTGRIPSSLGSVTTLEIFTATNNYLLGSIPTSFGFLNKLSSVDIGFNFLTGTIPPGIFLPSLRFLDLSDNFLRGSIPESISTSSNLTNLFLQDNRLTGTIPNTFVNLKNIEILEIYSNNLTGTIPDGIVNMESLRIVSLCTNFLHGTLPQGVWLSPHIVEINFGINMLTGTIPSNLGLISNLRFLFLPYNYLLGSIPGSFSKLSSLQSLIVSSNLLSGSFPIKIFESYTQLTSLSALSNFFTGSVPTSLFSISTLTSVYFSYNLFSGSIPEDVAFPSTMRNLWLYSNLLSGHFPNSIGASTQLISLLLSNNRFSGKFFELFETEVNTFSFVSVSIANNLFSGPMSWNFSKFPYLSTLIASSNCLQGSLPDSLCTARNLTSLVLDVSGGNINCPINLELNRNKPFFVKGSFSSLGIGGTLPTCLFSMPAMSTIHLAGNQLHGSIPELSNYANSVLDNLALSNNAFVGTIPISIQQHSFYELDLSNNRLGGTLLGSFSITPSQSVLGLAVNRLSGPLPNALTINNRNISRVPTINILAANIFECNNANVPSNDANSNSYTCGSYDLNIAYYIFMSVSVLICLVAVILDKAVSMLKVHWLALSWKRKVCEWYSSAWTPIDSINETKGFLVTMLFIRNYALMLMCLCCAVLLPVYIALNVTGTGSIVSYQYGYVVSMAYLHGLGIVIFISAFLFAVLLVTRGAVMIFRSFLSAYFVVDQPMVHYSDSVWHVFGVYLLVLALHLVNITVTVCINALYVNAILNSISINQSQFLVLQIVISVFKVLWNGLYVPFATKRLEKFITHSRAMQSRYVMSIVNFVIAPCIATVTVNQSCFYYIFQETRPISETLSLVNTNCVVFDFLGEQCSNLLVSESVSSTIPPFHYSYACGTALLNSYVPVLFYVYVFYGVIIPLIRLILALSDSADSLSVYLTLMNFDPKLIRGRSILVDLVIHSTVLLTFGVSSPVLGIAICLAVIINITVSICFVGKLISLTQTLEKQINLSDLETANQNNNPITHTQDATSSNSSMNTQSSSILLYLEHVDIRDSWRSVIVCADLVVFVVVTFWAWLFFDMIADVYGWVSGVICSVLFEVLAVVLLLGFSYIVFRLLVWKPRMFERLNEYLSSSILFSPVSMNVDKSGRANETSSKISFAL